MSGNMTITTAIERIAHLMPTYRSPVLKGEGVWVLTSPGELPEEFRAAQEERTHHYMTTEDRATSRSKPDHAPRYIVTSYGVPIAWVTLDGRTHYADLFHLVETGARRAAIKRHQDAVRAVWPERMGHDAMGEPSIRVPAGHHEDDSTGHVRHVLNERDDFIEGERVATSDGRQGTIYTDEAGGFVRVTLDGDRVDSLIDVTKLRRI